jgi:hypothetical protein
MAVDLEARPVGLHDVESLEIGTERTDVADAVVVVELGYGHDLAVDHLDHLAGGAVDEAGDVLDRVGVAVVGREVAEVGDDLGEASPFFERMTE